MAQIINPSEFYKYEYFSKAFLVWKPLEKTDCPALLIKSGYEIRLKKIYRYEL